MYNDKLRQARIDYTEAALVEMNAICNVIENDDMEKCELLQQRAQEFGEMAQEKYTNPKTLLYSHQATNVFMSKPSGVSNCSRVSVTWIPPLINSLVSPVMSVQVWSV